MAQVNEVEGFQKLIVTVQRSFPKDKNARKTSRENFDWTYFRRLEWQISKKEGSISASSEIFPFTNSIKLC